MTVEVNGGSGCGCVVLLALAAIGLPLLWVAARWAWRLAIWG